MWNFTHTLGGLRGQREYAEISYAAAADAKRSNMTRLKHGNARWLHTATRLSWRYIRRQIRTVQVSSEMISNISASAHHQSQSEDDEVCSPKGLSYNSQRLFWTGRGSSDKNCWRTDLLHHGQFP